MENGEHVNKYCKYPNNIVLKKKGKKGGEEYDPLIVPANKGKLLQIIFS